MKCKKLEDSRVAAFRSLIHERQAARMKWGTEMEDSRVAAFRSLIHEKQAARMKCRELESTARIHPSLYPDLVQMTSQLHEKGCARNPTHEADMSKFHGSTAAVSPFAANRPSCVMPPAASSAMNSSNCGQGWKGKPHSQEFPRVLEF